MTWSKKRATKKACRQVIRCCFCHDVYLSATIIASETNQINYRESSYYTRKAEWASLTKNRDDMSAPQK